LLSYASIFTHFIPSPSSFSAHVSPHQHPSQIFPIPQTPFPFPVFFLLGHQKIDFFLAVRFFQVHFDFPILIFFLDKLDDDENSL
jgi:hypothetical protein